MAQFDECLAGIVWERAVEMMNDRVHMSLETWTMACRKYNMGTCEMIEVHFGIRLWKHMAISRLEVASYANVIRTILQCSKTPKIHVVIHPVDWSKSNMRERAVADDDSNSDSDSNSNNALLSSLSSLSSASSSCFSYYTTEQFEKAVLHLLQRRSLEFELTLQVRAV